MLIEEKFNGFYNTFKGVVARHNKSDPHKKVDIVDDPKTEFKNRKIFDSWNSGDITT